MSAAVLHRVVCCLTMLLLLEAKLTAAEHKEKEIDFPTLPAGAGKIDKDAEKEFTKPSRVCDIGSCVRARARSPRRPTK